jgi:hydroxymethylbilane synthase
MQVNSSDLVLKPDLVLKIGARGSPLSLAQTGQLRAQLAEALAIPATDVETRLPITPITTTGDRIQDRALAEAGGKGLFTKELDDALLDGRIDCAVHSLKDVPTALPDGIVLLAGPKREDRRDALITLEGLKLDELKYGAVVGSASLRRGAQLLHARPDLRIVVMRGNVGTRLEKLRAGLVDATLLAAAGLSRLGLEDVPHTMLDPEQMPPAIGQGALAITARAGDQMVADAFGLIADHDTALEVAAERAFLSALDGSCRTAIGALATIDAHGQLTLAGEAFSEGGALRWHYQDTLAEPCLQTAQDFGRRIGLFIKSQAGDQLAGLG